MCNYRIQAWFRGVVARRRVQAMIDERIRAAIRIQALSFSPLPAKTTDGTFLQAWIRGQMARRARLRETSAILIQVRAVVRCRIS
jgi:hypothetical protein